MTLMSCLLQSEKFCKEIRKYENKLSYSVDQLCYSCTYYSKLCFCILFNNVQHINLAKVPVPYKVGKRLHLFLPGNASGNGI